MLDIIMEKLTEIVKPERILPTAIEFVDIARLVVGPSKGDEDSGNRFLAKNNAQVIGVTLSLWSLARYRKQGFEACNGMECLVTR